MMTTENAHLKPPSDSRPLLTAEMTPDQINSLVQMQRAVEAILKEIGDKPQKNEKNSDEDSWPIARPSMTRSGRAMLIEGGRGTGKSSLMLTLLDRWSACRPGASDDVRKRAGEDAVTESWPIAELPETAATEKQQWYNAEIGQKVLALPPLDFDPMPKGLPLIAWILQHIQRLVKHVDGVTTCSSLDGLERHRHEHLNLRQMWTRLHDNAVSGWEDTPDGSQPFHARDDREKQRLRSWATFVEEYRAAMDQLFERIQKNAHIKEVRLIVLPIDDADMQVLRCTELMLALRVLYHPQLIFLVTGDQAQIQQVVQAQMWGQFRDVGRGLIGRRKEMALRDIGQQVEQKVFGAAHTFPQRRFDLIGTLRFLKKRADLLEPEARPVWSRWTDKLLTSNLLKLVSQRWNITFRDLRDVISLLDTMYQDSIRSEMPEVDPFMGILAGYSDTSYFVLQKGWRKSDILPAYEAAVVALQNAGEGWKYTWAARKVFQEDDADIHVAHSLSSANAQKDIFSIFLSMWGSKSERLRQVDPFGQGIVGGGLILGPSRVGRKRVPWPADASIDSKIRRGDVLGVAEELNMSLSIHDFIPLHEQSYSLWALILAWIFVNSDPEQLRSALKIDSFRAAGLSDDTLQNRIRITVQFSYSAYLVTLGLIHPTSGLPISIRATLLQIALQPERQFGGWTQTVYDPFHQAEKHLKQRLTALGLSEGRLKGLIDFAGLNPSEAPGDPWYRLRLIAEHGPGAWAFTRFAIGQGAQANQLLQFPLDPYNREDGLSVPPFRFFVGPGNAGIDTPPGPTYGAAEALGKLWLEQHGKNAAAWDAALWLPTKRQPAAQWFFELWQLAAADLGGNWLAALTVSRDGLLLNYRGPKVELTWIPKGEHGLLEFAMQWAAVDPETKLGLIPAGHALVGLLGMLHDLTITAAKTPIEQIRLAEDLSVHDASALSIFGLPKFRRFILADRLLCARQRVGKGLDSLSATGLIYPYIVTRWIRLVWRFQNTVEHEHSMQAPDLSGEPAVLLPQPNELPGFGGELTEERRDLAVWCLQIYPRLVEFFPPRMYPRWENWTENWRNATGPDADIVRQAVKDKLQRPSRETITELLHQVLDTPEPTPPAEESPTPPAPEKPPQ